MITDNTKEHTLKSHFGKSAGGENVRNTKEVTERHKGVYEPRQRKRTVNEQKKISIWAVTERREKRLRGSFTRDDCSMGLAHGR